MSFGKNTLSDAGFSLAESVAMGTILAVVSVAFLNIQKEGHRNKSLVKYYEIINLTVNTIENHLIDYKKSKAFLNSLNKGDISGTSGYPVNKITVGPGNSILKVSVSNMKGKVNDKEIKIPASPNDHLIKNRLYISDMRLFYKRKFKSAEDSQTTSGSLVVSKEEEHGMIFVEISFRLNVLGVEKNIKRQVVANIVYKNDESFSRTLSPGGRIAKVLEDEVCSTKYDGIYVGNYVNGKCRGYRRFASQAVSRQICKELGGKVDGNGKCQYDFFPLLTDCPKGIKGFDAQGNAICSVPVSLIRVALSEDNTCALKEGILKCWGDNTYGQLGIGYNSPNNKTTPQTVKLPTGKKAISVEMSKKHMCAVLNNNDLTCWGKPSLGYLWPDVTSSFLPKQVIIPSGKKVLSFKTTKEHYCFMADDKSLECWGKNDSGQLGTSSSSFIRQPHPVAVGTTVKSFIVKKKNTCAIVDNDRLKCWGYNHSGQVGYGRQTPKEIRPKNVSLGGKAVSISMGIASNPCAILKNGTLKCWGSNSQGQLGAGFMGGKSATPLTVNVGGQTVKSVKHYNNTVCAILNDDSVKCWGENFHGQVGTGGGNKHTPKTVRNLGVKVTSLEMGNKYNCAILDNGTLKCWGKNNKGQLGDGTTTIRRSATFVKIPVGRKVKSVRLGREHTCAVLDNKTLWCWGSNFLGQLGIGNKTNKKTPQNVGL